MYDVDASPGIDNSKFQMHVEDEVQTTEVTPVNYPDTNTSRISNYRGTSMIWRRALQELFS